MQPHQPTKENATQAQRDPSAAPRAFRAIVESPIGPKIAARVVAADEAQAKERLASIVPGFRLHKLEEAGR